MMKWPSYVHSQLLSSAGTVVVVGLFLSLSLPTALMIGGVEQQQQHFRLRASARRETKVCYLTRMTLLLTSGCCSLQIQKCGIDQKLKTSQKAVSLSIGALLRRTRSGDLRFGRVCLGTSGNKGSFVPLACLEPSSCLEINARTSALYHRHSTSSFLPAIVEITLCRPPHSLHTSLCTLIFPLDS
jgi:hypothetical protein